MRHSTEQVDARLRAYGLPVDAQWLSVAPTGPHPVGDVLQRAASALGGFCLSIDLDPRWVKRLVAAGRADEVEAYTDHLVEQCRRILPGQDIGVLAAIPGPPAGTVRAGGRPPEGDHLGGTHMDTDTRHLSAPTCRSSAYTATP
ncbi:hypothetical protein [Streptomyces spinoverrucosus]|uniref:hypothetical protein n=1 Tax=Streptomyces spinoverrucosus TaxID=284043 RepID=UPI001E38484E|nr:hypothetical protein [Streptomyces spinoverrucosus]